MEIHLRDIKIYAYHGLHQGEETLGNEFVVNLTVSYAIKNMIITSIEDTINYAILYDIVKEQMAIRCDLLETVAGRIADKIFEDFPIAQSVEISIHKQHPPISNFQGSVGVTHKLYR